MFSNEGLIDLEKILKEKYNYTFTSLEDLSKQPFVEIEGYGVDALLWITIDNERFLFKPLKKAKYEVWGELLCEKIAEELGIYCAEYRAVKLGNIKGVLSKDFLKDDERLMVGSEVLQDFFINYPYYKKDEDDPIFEETFSNLYQIPKEYKKLDKYQQMKKIFKHLNNIQDIWCILETLIKNKETVSNIVNVLLSHFVFDCITLQGDRHPNNWGIISDGEHLKAAPLFDNSSALGLGYPNIEERINNLRSSAMSVRYSGYDQVNNFIYQSGASFTLKNPFMNNSEYKLKQTVLDTFTDLIGDSESELVKNIYKQLNSLDEDTIERLIIKVEEENGIKMPSELHFYITFILDYNINNLKKIIQEKRKDDIDDRTR